MSRLGITYEEVAEAALSIQKKGERPTIDKVRTYLGGTGSNTTISKYLHAWQHPPIPVPINKGEKPMAPDIVKAAVDRVWQEMKEQTDADIEAIKNAAQEQIEAAEKRTEIAENNLKQLQVKHAALDEMHRAQSAEKELLLLDVKRLQEEQALLQERYQGLEQRYTDMQGLTAQHITDVTHAHKNEIARLDEQCRRQDESHHKLVNEIKEHSENERHQLMMALDNLRVENQKQIKLKNELQSQLQEKLRITTKLETHLNALVKEKDEALARLSEQNEQWTTFNSKSFVADDILTKIVDMPTFDSLLDKFNAHFIEVADKKLDEFQESIRFLKIGKQRETQNE